VNLHPKEGLSKFLSKTAEKFPAFLSFHQAGFNLSFSNFEKLADFFENILFSKLPKLTS
jgi:hypothetical protein